MPLWLVHVQVAIPVQKSLLGESSFSLNDLTPLLSHWIVHQSCNSPCVDLLFSLLGSSWGVVCLMSCWNVNVTYANLPWRLVGWMWMRSTMLSRVVSWRTSMCGWSAMGLVWCAALGSMAVISICGVWASWATPGVAVIIPMSWLWVGSVWIMMTQAAMSVKMRLWSGMTSPVPVLTVVPQTWSGMVASVRSGWWCFGGVPKGGMLCGQSMTMWPYSSHLKHLMLGQFCVICPCSWHWKQWTSSFDIMLTVEGGIIMAVSCCTALSFSTSEITSVSICGSFLIDASSQTKGILQTFDEDPDGGCIIHKVASLSFHLESVDVCCKGFLFLLLDFHEAWGVSMNISIAKL